jgi:hypothetical protein
VEFEDSWQNHGCGTTSEMIEATGLTCNTLYYWRVFAWSGSIGGHSDYETVQTAAC